MCVYKYTYVCVYIYTCMYVSYIYVECKKTASNGLVYKVELRSHDVDRHPNRGVYMLICRYTYTCIHVQVYAYIYCSSATACKYIRD